MADKPTRRSEDAPPEVEQQILTANRVLNYDYRSTGGAPAAGFAYQAPGSLGTLAVNVTDHDAKDNTAFFNTLTAGDALVVNNVAWKITNVVIAAGVMTLTVTPAVTAPPFGVEPLNFVPYNTLSVFPAFTPIVPPPLFGVGGGAPPNYPPPTPPPIGAVPVGVLVGPAIAPAAVPPSKAGFPLIQYKSGSAVLPAAPTGYFPKFTSTFPSPTIVFSNIYTGGKPPSTPPSTASTLNIVLNGWGPNVPAGAPTTPGGDGRFPRSLMMAEPEMAQQALPLAAEPEAPAKNERLRRKRAV